MTERQLGNVAITAMGLWLLIQTISSATFYALWFAGLIEHSASSVAAAIISLIVLLATSAGLILYRHQLNRWLFREDSLVPPKDSLQLVSGLLAVLGVYFALTGLIEIMAFEGERWLMLRRIQEDVPRPLFELNSGPSDLQLRILNGTRLAIGIALFFGSQGIARVWNRLRTASLHA